MITIGHLNVKRIIQWLIKLSGSPEAVGLGVAIGIFVGFSPLMGLHMLIAAFFATFMNANRAAAVAAVWITNPLTFLPVYFFTYRVGKYLLSAGPGEKDARQIISTISKNIMALEFWEVYHQFMIIKTLGRKIFVHLLFGGALVGFVAGAASYLLAIIIIKTFRKAKD